MRESFLSGDLRQLAEWIRMTRDAGREVDLLVVRRTLALLASEAQTLEADLERETRLRRDALDHIAALTTPDDEVAAAIKASANVVDLRAVFEREVASSSAADVSSGGKDGDAA